MNRFLSVLLIATTPSVLFAADWGESDERDRLTDEEILIYNETITAFLDASEDETLAELTLGDLRALGARLSVVGQQEDYVRSARRASYMFPGSGHFMIDEPGVGAAFATGALLVGAGTLVGAYLLLPDDLKFDELDYINDSFRDISREWRGESIASMAPAAGVLIGGMIVNAILGEIAASDAESRARAQIASGAVAFDPQPFIYPDAHGRLILGARVGF